MSTTRTCSSPAMALRPLMVWLAVSAALAVGSGALGAEDPDSEKMRAYRAAFVLKFMDYTTWPASSFEDEAGPLVVAVVGSPVGPHLRRLAGDARIHGRPVVVWHMGAPPEPGEERDAYFARLSRAHVMYMGRSMERHTRTLLSELSGRPILTISSSEHFARRGGMLGLVLEGGRYAFEANPEVITNAGLKMSSRVLELARIVRTEER